LAVLHWLYLFGGLPEKRSQLPLHKKLLVELELVLQRVALEE
jgi:hypothetical protein